MPGRLLEAGAERAEKLRRWLKGCCDHLLVYAYGDWLTRHRGLAGLAREAGLELLEPVEHASASLARVM